MDGDRAVYDRYANNGGGASVYDFNCKLKRNEIHFLKETIMDGEKIFLSSYYGVTVRINGKNV